MEPLWNPCDGFLREGRNPTFGLTPLCHVFMEMKIKMIFYEPVSNAFPFIGRDYTVDKVNDEFW